jgi:hypothetical protein
MDNVDLDKNVYIGEIFSNMCSKGRLPLVKFLLAQECSCTNSCKQRSLRQQNLTKAYHVSKHKEFNEMWVAFFYGFLSTTTDT